MGWRRRELAQSGELKLEMGAISPKRPIAILFTDICDHFTDICDLFTDICDLFTDICDLSTDICDLFTDKSHFFRPAKVAQAHP